MSKKVLLLVLSCVLLLVFTYFSYLVHKETFNQFDFDTTVKIQDRISRKFDLPFSFFSVLGSAEFTMLGWMILLVYLFFKRYWLTICASFLFFVSVAVEIFGKIMIYHPAPPHLFYRGEISFHFASDYVHTSYSYPSGHITRTAFLITLVLLLLWSRSSVYKNIFVQIMLLLFYAGMLVSRVYLGEHWTSDVIGGFLLGTAFALLVGITIPLKKRIVDETSD